jgi:perosamine synthetase
MGKFVLRRIGEPVHYRYPLAKPAIGQKEKELVMDCLETGWISSKGGYVRQFEENLAEYCTRSDALATSSGTTALHLALLAIGLKPGDEVIVPTLTFIAPVNTILYCGATPVFCDTTREDDWQMDVRLVRDLVTPKRTKAIIAVHLYGMTCDIQYLKNFCLENDIWLIEDAAEAIGGYVDGRPVGGHGDISCMSLFANKSITSGEGGAALTNEPLFFYRMRMLRDHGMDPNKPYFHPVMGYNYRMTNVQGALAVAQLNKLDQFTKIKAGIWGGYKERLGNLVEFPKPYFMHSPSYWLTSVLVPEEKRDGLIQHLANNGIEARPFFIPAHHMPYLNSRQECPVATKLYKRGISLPTYVGLKEEDLDFIAWTVSSFLKA